MHCKLLLEPKAQYVGKIWDLKSVKILSVDFKNDYLELKIAEESMFQKSFEIRVYVKILYPHAKILYLMNYFKCFQKKKREIEYNFLLIDPKESLKSKYVCFDSK